MIRLIHLIKRLSQPYFILFYYLFDMRMKILGFQAIKDIK